MRDRNQNESFGNKKSLLSLPLTFVLMFVWTISVKDIWQICIKLDMSSQNLYLRLELFPPQKLKPN